MSKHLSEREGIVLAAILDAMPYGANGNDLVRFVRGRTGAIGVNDVTAAGCHRTAGSLCRKDLAWRAGTPKLQWYKITQTGRDVLDGRARDWRLPS